MQSADAARTVEIALRTGMTFHERGDLANAEACYRGALGQFPEHPYALHLLALAAYQRGSPAEGLALIERAIARHEKDAKLHVNHANCLRALGRIDDARLAYERALRLDPRRVDGWNGLGNLLREAGRPNEAVAAYRDGLRQAPGHEALGSNLAVALHEAGRAAEALPILEQYAVMKPRDPEAHYNLGNTFAALGRLQDAAGALRRAVELRPEFVQAWCNLGNALFGLRKGAEAIDAFQRAVDLDRTLHKACVSLATALSSMGGESDAQRTAQAWQRVVELQPGNVEAHCSLGNALFALERVEAAAQAFGRATELDPACAAAYVGLATLLEKSGRYVEAVQCCERALAFDPALAAGWEIKAKALWHQGLLAQASAAFRRAQERLPDRGGLASSYLFTLNYLDGVDPAAIVEAHRERGRSLAGMAAPRPALRRTGRIRVGLVSGDFRRHSVAYFALPLIERLDRGRFEVACYYTEGDEDDLTGRFRQAADLWCDAKPLGDEALAERIRADGIDVLFDLAGHTAGNRLGVFARRAAPVQASWLGYPTTTGLTQMDYRLTDRAIDPEGSEAMNVECPLRLAGSYFCYGGPGIEPDIGALPMLAGGRVTFGSFNNLAKMSPAAMQLWVRVLEAVPGSRLSLKSRALVDEKTAEDVCRRFEALGLARERLDLSAWKSSIETHLQAYCAMDVALDSFPYNGATTTCEALWMGVPVVSLAGVTHASRMGRSILGAAGLPAMAAASEEDYVATAVRLTKEPAQLAALRAGLRTRLRRSPLMDAERFAHDFGAAIDAMVAAQL